MFLYAVIKTHLLELSLSALFDKLNGTFNRGGMETPYYGEIKEGMRFSKIVWTSSKMFASHPALWTEIIYTNTKILKVDNFMGDGIEVNYQYDDLIPNGDHTASHRGPGDDWDGIESLTFYI